MKYDKIFNRVEEKYILNEQQKNEFFLKIKNHIKEDPFFQTEIYNIYFDNPNNDLIINSMEKPIFKEKIRLRSYGVPTLNDPVFFEIKTKYKGIVGKRRIKITLKEFYEYLENKENFSKNQIMKEIDYLYQYYHLNPYIFVRYSRLSYQGIEEDNLRITLDSNLKSRRDHLRLELGDKGAKEYFPNIYIMEIKTLNAMPLWLVSALSELKIFPTSFSKVGKIYQKIKEEV